MTVRPQTSGDGPPRALTWATETANMAEAKSQGQTKEVGFGGGNAGLVIQQHREADENT